VDSITGQLQNVSRVAQHFDVVAIIRGGGGDVGLNCYDNYFLAREVAMCPLPVLTGIGHSTNETVVEMVAGHNKITPTDVAYFLIQQFHNFSARVNDCQEKIIILTREMVEEEKRRWGELSKRLLLQTDNLLRLEKKMLEQVSGNVISCSRTMLAEHRHMISLSASRLRFKPGLLIREREIELKNRSEWFAMRIRQLMNHQHLNLDKLDRQVHLLDPKNILKRGYSITYFDGKPVTDNTGLKPGDEIITQLYKGNICSEVKSKKE
jgi:exodeoxyribonuclease VII large subunit